MTMMLNRSIMAGLMICMSLFAVACETAPDTQFEREILMEESQDTMAAFKRIDPAIQQNFFNTAVAYAVFPEVTKGGAGVGGAHGRGILYEDGQPTGYVSLTQATIGLQLGGQSYSQIIFFKDRTPLRKFKNDQFEVAAQASGVMVDEDVSTNVDYENGVAIFTYDARGAMGEAAVGGQEFDFVPMP